MSLQDLHLETGPILGFSVFKGSMKKLPNKRLMNRFLTVISKHLEETQIRELQTFVTETRVQTQDMTDSCFQTHSERRVHQEFITCRLMRHHPSLLCERQDREGQGPAPNVLTINPPSYSKSPRASPSIKW
jgi:hypothetical protein